MSISNTPISFVGYRIEKLSYSHEETAPDGNLKFEGGVGISDDLDEGIVRQKISVFNSNNKILINIEMIGNFKNNAQLSKDKFEEFLGVNGSAMLYPYIRSICSLLSSLDSSENTVIPALNFKDAYEEYIRKSENN